jgi:putative mRNA 3-end processing factor
VRCHTFVTESTFGLPIYRWSEPARVMEGIEAWWRGNAAAGRASVLFAYAFGKAQRILASIDASIGPILVHGAVDTLDRAYAQARVVLPEARVAIELEKGFDVAGALVIAPPSAQSTPWLKRFGDYSDAFASGWMAIRGARRRMAIDQGFVLSDHADWPGLNRAIDATGASRVLVTHGHAQPLAQWLAQRGLDASVLATPFEGEQGAAA